MRRYILARRSQGYERTVLRLIIPKATSPVPNSPSEAGSGVAAALCSVGCVLIVNVSGPSLTIFPLSCVAVTASDPPLNKPKFAEGKVKENGSMIIPVSHAASGAQLANNNPPALRSSPAASGKLEFPNVPVSVAEIICWSSGIVYMKVPTSNVIPNGPVVFNGPLNSGRVALIVAAFKQSAETARSRTHIRVL
jgi:hypothetical protein